jgi:cytochrome c oxidase cbb3-type subunit 3
MSQFWSLYITLITVATIAACYWMIRWTTKHRPNEAAQGDVTGHTWDDNLQEYNNPLPRWWLYLFYLTIVFAIVYLILYPGLGNFAGKFAWTQNGQYQAEMAAADRDYAPLFAAFAKQDIPSLAKDTKAMRAAQNLFLNNCASCHGSDGGGAPGFPNLTDTDWIYGGEPAAIQQTILDGRNSIGMPAMAMGMPEPQLNQLVDYVRSLSNQANVNADNAKAGKTLFDTMCVSCHGADGKGMLALGAPNLADNIWLYGGSVESIKETLTKGRKGVMPAHRELLGEDKAHLLAAYVYGFSNK